MLVGCLRRTGRAEVARGGAIAQLRKRARALLAGLFRRGLVACYRDAVTFYGLDEQLADNVGAVELDPRLATELRGNPVNAEHHRAVNDDAQVERLAGHRRLGRFATHARGEYRAFLS